MMGKAIEYDDDGNLINAVSAAEKESFHTTKRKSDEAWKY